MTMWDFAHENSTGLFICFLLVVLLARSFRTD